MNKRKESSKNPSNTLKNYNTAKMKTRTMPREEKRGISYNIIYIFLFILYFIFFLLEKKKKNFYLEMLTEPSSVRPSDYFRPI